MNGRNGIHHCLLPEEIRLVLFNKDDKKNYIVTNELQSPEDLCKLMQCNSEHLKKFM